VIKVLRDSDCQYYYDQRPGHRKSKMKNAQHHGVLNWNRVQRGGAPSRLAPSLHQTAPQLETALIMAICAQGC